MNGNTFMNRKIKVREQSEFMKQSEMVNEKGRARARMKETWQES